MTPKPRWHAEITGKFVQFYSRDPRKPNSRPASRWKAEYATLAHAEEAKRVWEAQGYPLWPDDLKRGKSRKDDIVPERVSGKRSNEQAELRV